MCEKFIVLAKEVHQLRDVSVDGIVLALIEGDPDQTIKDAFRAFGFKDEQSITELGCTSPKATNYSLIESPDPKFHYAWITYEGYPEEVQEEAEVLEFPLGYCEWCNSRGCKTGR